MILDEFPNYDITQDGKVFSLNYNNTGERKEMKQRLNKYGYMQIGITDLNGKRKFRQVHRLVGQAFVPNPMEKEEINHIDGVKTNNVSTNLEWCTSSENQQHAFNTGLNKAHKSNCNGNYQGTDVIHSKLTEEDVIAIRARHANMESPYVLAKEYGISGFALSMAVSQVAKGRTWKHLPYPEKMDMKDKQRKGVIQMDKQGNIVAEFDSLLEAEKATGIAHSGIGRVCRGNAKTAGDYIWKYKEVV